VLAELVFEFGDPVLGFAPDVVVDGHLAAAVAEFGLGRECAQLGVGGDLINGGFGAQVGVVGFGEVEAGDLEAVEEQAGAAWVDVVGGDGLEDAADGGLDGGAVFGEREIEGASAGLSLTRANGGLAGGVVVVAEVLVAETDAAAAASVGEDVAALVAFACHGVDGVHGFPPPTGVFVCKVFERDGLGLDFCGRTPPMPR
jgi:hypothetical protein